MYEKNLILNKKLREKYVKDFNKIKCNFYRHGLMALFSSGLIELKQIKYSWKNVNFLSFYYSHLSYSTLCLFAADIHQYFGD